MGKLAAILAAIGSVAATMGTQACLAWLMDEPKMPKSLIEK